MSRLGPGRANKRRRELVPEHYTGKFKVGDRVRIYEESTGVISNLFPTALIPYEVEVNKGEMNSGCYYESSLDFEDINQKAELENFFKSIDPVTLRDKQPFVGINKDDGKLRVDLVPTSAIRAIAEVLGQACRPDAQGNPPKYPPNNWRNGIEYSRIYANILRHLLDWYDGKNVDAESGLHPLHHAICRLAMLVEYTDKNMEGFDDRPSKPSKTL